MADIPPSSNKQEQVSLGIAGRMAKAFIHSPLSPLFFVALLGMGLMGLVLTPRQEDPQISVPMVDVFVQYSGASSEQVAKRAIEPLQRILSEIPAVKHVYGAAEHGRGMVTVQFKVGEELEKSVFKVHDKLQSNAEKMPPGVSRPLVKPRGIDDVSVVNFTLWSEQMNDAALRTLSFDVLQSLKEIPNTGRGFIVGGRTEQLRVEIMPERLSGFNMGVEQVANTILTANSEVSAGTLESNNLSYSLHSGRFLRNAKDVERLVVGSYEGRPVYVRDIAKVTQEPEETKKIVSYYTGAAYQYQQRTDGNSEITHINGAPAVTIAIAKKIGSNGVEVADALLKKIKQLQGRLIPSNVHVEITRNYGKSANDKVNGLIKKLLIATGAVTLLVLLSLGWRPALVVTLVIPVVILITIFSAFVLGFTIDRVSLFALIFSIGILVDDAIVVMENIYRRWLINGKTDTETAVDAVREVGNPTILATFTVVAALLPMGFVSGMMGPYMLPIPILGSVAMIFSLFAAFIFTPWLAMLLKPSLTVLHQSEKKEERIDNFLENFFRRLLTPLITKPKIGWLFFLSLIIAFFLAISMFYTRTVEVKMLPLDNKPEFNVFIDMPEGTALPVTATMAMQLTEKLRQLPEVVAIQSYVGTSQPFDFNGMVRHYYLREKPWQADLHIQLKDKKDRQRSSHEVSTEARRLLKDMLKGSDTKITIVEMPPGPPVLQSIVAEVYGPDDKTRKEVAADLTQFFEQAKIIDDVDNYMTSPYSYVHFEVDTEKAVRKGISVDTINRNLSMVMGGYRLGDIKQGSALEPTYIVIQAPFSVRSQLSRLSDLPIPTMDGSQTLPLIELGKFVTRRQDDTIFYKNLRRVEYVVGDSIGIYQGDNQYTESSPIYGILEVEELLKNYTTPDGIVMSGNFISPPEANGESAFQWVGEWTVTYETFRDMGMAFVVALILIYMLVVWLFGNFIIPAIIMAPIPLTLLGIIPGHWLFDAEFTATSMIGWIALAGIIVRNSILLVDYSIQEVKKGTELQDAVILACRTRTRPIMITAFALVGGSSVILYDPIFQGMAISLLFGVMISTILTLVVIPLGCISAGKNALLGADAPIDEPSIDDNKTTQTTLRSRSIISEIVEFIYYMIRAIFIMFGMGIMALIALIKTKQEKPTIKPSTPIVPQKAEEPATTETVTQKTQPILPVLIIEENKETPIETTKVKKTKPKTIPATKITKNSAAKKPATRKTNPTEKTAEKANSKPTAKKTTRKTSTAKPKRRGIRLKPMSPKKDDDKEDN